MSTPDADYQSCLKSSERVSWKIDDILPEGTTLDFSSRVLPDALIAGESIGCLSPRERLLLNQIRANSYAHLFLFLEEYAVALASHRASLELHGNATHMRALLRFTDEELKHQQLFSRYVAAFSRGFVVPPALLDNRVEVAKAIMSKSNLAVLILNLHLELLTQQHYVETIRGNDREGLDPLFSNMLKHHWLEEAQHARLDALEIQKILARTPEALEPAMAEYAELLAALRGTLIAQLELDIQTLEKAAGRSFTEAERKEIFEAQERSYIFGFIGMGMKSPLFIARLREVAPAAEQHVLALSPSYYAN